ncbi:pyridoxine/pyridoxamine 5'-phosphate oxidase-like isoform X2 [Sycon ciliatum]|uniref:pyridoxine/pyridoxamine 5'-phosphate oxidase-like isoform X2 n=1 Tax=Sycon ciliatum TaxID=27933 RepID=UPI0031F6373F
MFHQVACGAGRRVVSFFGSATFKSSRVPFLRTLTMAAEKRFEMGEEVAALRKNYESAPFTEDQLVSDRDPIAQFDNWFSLAKETGTTYEEVNAMTLATCTPDGRPSARVVLLKGYGQDGFRFFSHYDSRKGGELSANPFAALVFYWPALNRSVRIEGRVERLPADVSEKYFHSRPHGSQIGAACSKQSTVIESRDQIAQAYSDLATRFPEGTDVPRPDHWGGFLVRPDAIEFWQGQSSRLHDRIKFKRSDDTEGAWAVQRLSP